MTRWGRKPQTAADGKVDLIAFLYGCTDAALAAVTVEQLTARHCVDAKLAEYELAIARQKRAGGA